MSDQRWDDHCTYPVGQDSVRLQATADIEQAKIGRILGASISVIGS